MFKLPLPNPDRLILFFNESMEIRLRKLALSKPKAIYTDFTIAMGMTSIVCCRKFDD